MMCAAMDELRPDQEALLADHRERARDPLDELLRELKPLRGLPDPGNAPLRDLVRHEPKVLVACVVSLLADEHERFLAIFEATGESGDPHGDALRALQAALEAALSDADTKLPEPDPMHVVGMVLAGLQPRRLPFSAADVELMLDLGVEKTAFWRIGYPVAAAERMLARAPGSPPVLASLERASRRLEEHPKAAYEPELRAARIRIRALLAASVPGGLLDLSVVEDGDAWAEPARTALESHARRWEGVQDLLAHFASARGSKPTKRWAGRATELFGTHPEAASLTRQLLDLVLEIDVVVTPDAVPWPPRWLLTPGNETLLKGAAWSVRFAPDDSVVPLLGRLALRGAAPSPDDAVTTPLSASVANAAVDSLIALGSDDARDELRRLLSELRRRDLLKRIAAALDEAPAETATRDEAIARQKKRAVRAKADPRPQQEQRAASQRVRTELAPRLRDLGFAARSGRTFWRHNADRVEVLHVASIRGDLAVEIGVWFRAPRRLRQPPIRDGERCPTIGSCDLGERLAVEELAQAALEAETWFLRWADPADVLSVLLSDAVVPRAGAPGSAVRDTLIGYLAPLAGDPQLAAEHLARAASFYRERLEQQRGLVSEAVTGELEVWVQGLEADAAGAA